MLQHPILRASREPSCGHGSTAEGFRSINYRGLGSWVCASLGVLPGSKYNYVITTSLDQSARFPESW